MTVGSEKEQVGAQNILSEISSAIGNDCKTGLEKVREKLVELNCVIDNMFSLWDKVFLNNLFF